MPNPLISQGTLNRLQANITWYGFPSLNVTPSFLAKPAIRLALEGNSVDYINTLTGAVPSPAPYMPIRLSVHLLKSQQLGSLYKAQMEVSALLGDGTVFPDVPAGTGITPYLLTNCAIMTVRELAFDGMDAEWSVDIGGYYLLNNSLWG